MQIGTIKTFIMRTLFCLLTEGENIQQKSTQWSEALIVWVPFWRYTSVKVKSLGSAEEEADEIQSNALQRSD